MLSFDRCQYMLRSQRDKHRHNKENFKNRSNRFLKEFDLKQTKLHCAFLFGLINMLQIYVPISFANAGIFKTNCTLKNYLLGLNNSELIFLLGKYVKKPFQVFLDT